MLIFEFIFLFISLVFLVFSLIMSLIKFFTSPVREIHLIILAIISFLLNICFFLASAYLNEPNIIDPMGELWHKVGQIFAYAGLAFLTVTIILPNFRANYKQLMLFSSIIILFTSAALINYFTVNLEAGDMFIKIKNTTPGSLLTVIGIIILIYFIYQRYRQISKLTQQDATTKIIMKPFIVFGVLLGIIILFFSLARFNLEIFPGYGYFLPMAFTIFYFSIIFIKKLELFFLSPIKLYRVIIIDKSGMELYNKSFVKDQDIDNEFFSEILSGATKSLKKILDSDSGLDQIRYFDRVVQSSSEKDIVAYLILSDYNIITNSIVRWISKKFQNRYDADLRNKGLDLVEKDKFRDFDSTIAIVRKYLPF